MIIFKTTIEDFLIKNEDGNIDDFVAKSWQEATGSHVSPAERKSWMNSLRVVSTVLRDERLGRSLGVAVEFVLPLSSKRIDCTVAGYKNGRPSAVVIELKQWEKADITDMDGLVKTNVGKGFREVCHPCYQAWTYSEFFELFNEAVNDSKDGIQIKPCAYLHNYKRDGKIDSHIYDLYLNRAPLFTKGEGRRLANYLVDHVQSGDGIKVLEKLDDARLRPSKSLVSSIKEIISNNSDFVLLDDQKIVFEKCLAIARRATKDKPKVVLIKGGPGTGKSVVAMHLLAKLLSDCKAAVYVTKNSPPRKVLIKKLAKSNIQKDKLKFIFKGPDTFVDKPRNSVPVLIVDEAHRLCEKASYIKSDNVIFDLIKVGICSIFFIDEAQQVTWNDSGSIQGLINLAEEKGVKKEDVEILELSSQFRCSGSDDWLTWVDKVLGIKNDTLLIRSIENTKYDVRIFDDPESMHQEIEKLNDICKNGARVVAGYCWNWVSDKDQSKYDIEIGSYKKQWNLKSQMGTWIIEEGSVEQVGCIHTCQGLEVDYIGVIIGPDLTMEGGELITVPEKRAKTDRTLFGYKAALKDNPEAAKQKADRIIRNTYRTLLTRGMKGCFIYATDPKVREYLRSHLK